MGIISESNRQHQQQQQQKQNNEEPKLVGHVVEQMLERESIQTDNDGTTTTPSQSYSQQHQPGAPYSQPSPQPFDTAPTTLQTQTNYQYYVDAIPPNFNNTSKNNTSSTNTNMDSGVISESKQQQQQQQQKQQQQQQHHQQQDNEEAELFGNVEQMLEKQLMQRDKDSTLRDDASAKENHYNDTFNQRWVPPTKDKSTNNPISKPQQALAVGWDTNNKQCGEQLLQWGQQQQQGGRIWNQDGEEKALPTQQQRQQQQRGQKQQWQQQFQQPNQQNQHFKQSQQPVMDILIEVNKEKQITTATATTTTPRTECNLPLSSLIETPINNGNGAAKSALTTMLRPITTTDDSSRDSNENLVISSTSSNEPFVYDFTNDDDSMSVNSSSSSSSSSSSDSDSSSSDSSSDSSVEQTNKKPSKIIKQSNIIISQPTSKSRPIQLQTAPPPIPQPTRMRTSIPTAPSSYQASSSTIPAAPSRKRPSASNNSTKSASTLAPTPTQQHLDVAPTSLSRLWPDPSDVIKALTRWQPPLAVVRKNARGKSSIEFKGPIQVVQSGEETNPQQHLQKTKNQKQQQNQQQCSNPLLKSTPNTTNGKDIPRQFKNAVDMMGVMAHPLLNEVIVLIM